jgi:hypothetical protein
MKPAHLMAWLCAAVLAGCGPLEEQRTSQEIEYEKAFNTITLKTPPDALLSGFHMSFDTKSRKSCVTAKSGTKPSVGAPEEKFALDYKKSKSDLRSFFNIEAEAKVDLKLIHAKASASLTESLNRDSFGVFFGLHSFQYFQLGYDQKDLDLTEEAKNRLENKAARPLGTVAREHLLHCGPGYVREVRAGGQLDVVLEIAGSSYAKTQQIKKSVEVAVLGAGDRWHEDKTITDKMTGMTVQLAVFAMGFEFEGAPISNARAEAYIRGKIDAASRAGKSPAGAAIDALKTLHNALKVSVTAEQKGGCKHAVVFKGVLGNYLDLDDAPTTCGGKPVLTLRAEINEIADKMGRFAVGFLTAEAAAQRAFAEGLAFLAFRAKSWGHMFSGYGWDTLWHSDRQRWQEEYDLSSWLNPYIGSAPVCNAELDPGNKKGVRRVAWDYFTAVRDLLPAGPDDLTIIDRASVEHKKLKEWRMLVEDQNNFEDPTWKKRIYFWGKETSLRNLYTYRMQDRVRPIYVIKLEKNVAGTDLAKGTKKCDAAVGERYLNSGERFAVAAWASIPANHTNYGTSGNLMWMDPAAIKCPANELAIGNQSYVPQRPAPAGPAEWAGVSVLSCMSVNQSADLMCVPAEGGIFGADNPFDV